MQYYPALISKAIVLLTTFCNVTKTAVAGQQSVFPVPRGRRNSADFGCNHTHKLKPWTTTLWRRPVRVIEYALCIVFRIDFLRSILSLPSVDMSRTGLSALGPSWQCSSALSMCILSLTSMPFTAARLLLLFHTPFGGCCWSPTGLVVQTIDRQNWTHFSCGGFTR